MQNSGRKVTSNRKQNPIHSFKNKSKRVKLKIHSCAVPCLVAQSCLTLCNPMDCSPPGSSFHGDSPGKNTGVGCHALLQGIFPIQGSNPGLHSLVRFFSEFLSSHQENNFMKVETGFSSLLFIIFLASIQWQAHSRYSINIC